MSAADALTEEEEYIVWTEHVRTALRGSALVDPAEAYRTTYAFERHAVIDRRAELSVPSSSPTAGSSGLAGSEDAHGSVTSRGAFYDEESFPFCFYARMLRVREGQSDTTTSSSRSHVTGSTSWSVNHNGSSQSANDGEAVSSISQPRRRLAYDEELEASRIATKLRMNTRRQQREQRQKLVTEAVDAGGRAYTANAAALRGSTAFMDPTVEAAQARLHSELTDLLLTVRAANQRSADARSQLHYSRTLLQFTQPAAALSDSASSAADYESDFTD